MKVDLHVHTKYSPCSNIEPAELLEQAKKAGLDAVAVTDHNTLGGFRALKKIRGDVEVIPGIEISTGQGDLIGLFIEDEIEKNLGIGETADRIRELGGLVVVPHAFDSLRNSIGKNMLEAAPDAVEVYNSRVLFGSFNERAEEYAIVNNVVGVAGSDAHFREEIGLAGVFTGSDSVKSCIKKGQVKVYHQDPPLDVRAGIIGARFSRKLGKVKRRVLGGV